MKEDEEHPEAKKLRSFNETYDASPPRKHKGVVTASMEVEMDLS
jgi:hypothetical protein